MSYGMKSDPAEWEDLFAQYVESMRARLRAGFREYGDESLKKAPLELAREIEEELIDQANWSYLAFCRLRKTVEKLRALKQSRHCGDRGVGDRGEP